MAGKSLTHIDIFAGCGGLSLGLHNAGIHGLFAIERQPNAFQTLRTNLIDKHRHFLWPSWLEIQHWDIHNLLKIHYRNLIQMQGNVDILVGGPPCQGFSMAGLRRPTDERNLLIHAYLDFVEVIRPSVVLFENVKGFTMKFSDANTASYSELVLQKLRHLGYVDAVGRMIDFSYYGVPQRRQRFIVIATQHHIASDIFLKLDANKDTFLKQHNLTSSPISSRDALSDLEKQHGVVDCPDSPGFMSGVTSIAHSNYQQLLRLQHSTNYVPDSHRFVKHTPRIQQVFSNLLEYAPRNKTISGSQRELYGVRKRSVAVLDPDKPAPTITTIPDDIVHYTEPRILSVREMARLQTFPDWFEFKGPYTTGAKKRIHTAPRYTQVGNAVPPLFAEQIGIAIKQALS